MASFKKFTSCGNLKSVSRNFSTNASKPRPSVLFEPQQKSSSTNNKVVAPTATTLLHSPEFPLPGNVTTQYQYQADSIKQSVRTDSCLKSSDVLSTTTNHQRQMSSLKNFAQQAPATELNIGSSAASLECTAQDCPELVKKDLLDLFPNVQLNKSPLTVLSLAQKTENDMGAWTTQMELERDGLTADFIGTASSICDALREAGYWADFIDPSSGRPYLGPFTNATLFETDGRLRNFGFDIEDLGCCKVISHKLWGRNVFVGTLFTTAPLKSPAVQKILGIIGENDS